jgi:hypothetical protein
MFIVDNGFGRVRMVNGSGHISIFAGTNAGILSDVDGVLGCNPAATNYGDGGAATSAELQFPTFLQSTPR